MLTSDIETIMAWKSKELSGESNTPFTGLGNSVAPELKQIHNSKITVKFTENSLKQDKATLTRRKNLDDTSVTAEATYSVNITKSRKKICFKLHQHSANSFVFANRVKIHQFKAKNPE